MQRAVAQTPLPDHCPHRCPWWLGWALVSPLRRLIENPQTLLEPLIAPGNRVLEVGPGMGYFTPTIAKGVGEQGRVYCVDVQSRMLDQLRSRLARRGLGSRVETRVCSETDLAVSDLRDSIDLAVLVHVLHEIQDPRGALKAIAESLRPRGRLLLVEPPGHVSQTQFGTELAIAREVGLVPAPMPVATRRKSLSRLLMRTDGER